MFRWATAQTEDVLHRKIEIAKNRFSPEFKNRKKKNDFMRESSILR